MSHLHIAGSSEGDWVEGSGKILHSTNWLGTAYFGLRRSQLLRVKLRTFSSCCDEYSSEARRSAVGLCNRKADYFRSMMPPCVGLLFIRPFGARRVTCSVGRSRAPAESACSSRPRQFARVAKCGACDIRAAGPEAMGTYLPGRRHTP